MMTIPSSTQQRFIQTSPSEKHFVVEEGAIFDHYLVGGNGSIEVDVKPGGLYRPFLLSDKTTEQQTALTIRLGDGAETDLKALLTASADQQITADVVIIHTGSESMSEQFTKTLADNKARIRLTSTVKIEQQARQATARQMAKNLLLSEEAEIITEPKMEIDTDEVQASHGSSTGTLDPETLFYLQSRGMKTNEAKHLLVQAFVEELTNTIDDEKLRQEMLTTIPA